MQRRLILMRHAQSAHRSLQGSDHERTLTTRGAHDAPRVAQRLTNLGWAPQRALSSDASRTRETWEAMTTILTGCPPPHFTRSLYLAGLEEIWTESHSVDSDIETLLVLGHNPGWEEALFTLSGERRSMTPANAALMTGDGEDWATALRGRWALSQLIRPEDLA